MNSDQKKIASAYDQAAKAYEGWKWQRFWKNNERPIVQEILNNTPPGEFALDVGTGTGAYTDLLASRYRVVIGVDISISMIKISRLYHPYGPRVCATTLALPFKENTFQLVLAARVLSHVAALGTFFKETHDVLTPDGRLIVTDLDPEHEYTSINLPISGQSGRAHPLTPINHSIEELSAEARENGLVVERVQRLGFRELVWRPPANESWSLDRTGKRHIFYVLSFRSLGRQ